MPVTCIIPQYECKSHTKDDSEGIQIGLSSGFVNLIENVYISVLQQIKSPVVPQRIFPIDHNHKLDSSDVVNRTPLSANKALPLFL